MVRGGVLRAAAAAGADGSITFLAGVSAGFIRLTSVVFKSEALLLRV